MENDQQKEQDLREYIRTIGELDDEKKNKYISMLDVGESELVVLDEIDKSLQADLDAAFLEAGVELDENDPEYVAAHQVMLAEVEDAGKEHDNEMKGIDSEIVELDASAAKEMDEVAIRAIKERMM